MESVIAFVPDSELLRVERVKVNEVLGLLHTANKKDQLWFAFKNTGAPIQANDLLFFQSGTDASEFALNQKSVVESYQHLPIEATGRLLINHQCDNPQELIVLDTREIIKLQNEINFDRSVSMIEETMRRHHWKEFKPDELSLFISELKEMHDETEAGKVITEALTQQYWPDIPSETKLLSNNLNDTTMNEKNLDYLSNQLKYSGFGEDLNAQLKEKMQKGETEFSLFHQRDFGKDSTVATLHFRKSESSELYFFNRYSLLVKTPQASEPIKQTFNINNKDNVTLKEAYNLLSGRAVYKELTNKNDEKYKAWLQIDFKSTNEQGNYLMKQFHDKYGYDLKAVLEKHPIKELAISGDRERLMDSLERGNRQSVTIVMGGSEQKVFIEASPQFKSLNFYDDSMKRVQAQTIYDKMGVSAGASKELKEGEKVEGSKQSVRAKAGEEDDEGGGGQKQKRGKRQRIS